MNFEIIQRLIALAETSELGQIEVTDGTERIKVVNTTKTSMPIAPKTMSLAPPLGDDANNADESAIIKAASVGKFCLDGIALTTGDTIKAGDTVGGVLALGVLTPIIADKSGVLHDYLVKAGDKVEWGQAVLRLA
ncbi:hypothetical protein LP109_06460 [Moraxella bovis]|uniref:Biotin carboxyl carrier protein of acetyl-CoA carboxylase n=1 Tax=Moraxella caprae TaxID=90240 RepID=A0A378R0N9_9GAMM|nr:MULTISPECIES: biotin/lipoyl-containing protein [Moraxella]OOR88406.1 hypothetical protein B0182_10040 [Moraxella bovis]UZA17911.1 hypothetical protein LP109_06460 [Moraxella bovis]STZ08886.1 Biotin carboxyl carrier protein of acetyl-CoA carboxylase [Moraxella caprae]